MVLPDSELDREVNKRRVSFISALKSIDGEAELQQIARFTQESDGNVSLSVNDAYYIADSLSVVSMTKNKSSRRLYKVKFTENQVTGTLDWLSSE